ncbi:KTSC domain-containing protein [Alteribacter populi]|uniref:KTSC domain-containing protein n=1 Tax=Alteribacter populi TaxID=2011011 RepID=UPI000BBB4120|nr:KTSC domain-containing protein [Alteribacter populi]
MEMEFTQINDGTIESVAFDEIDGQLHIRYSNGKYIIYYEVRKTDYVGLLGSGGYSTYIEEKIAPGYPSYKVKGERL